MLYPSTYWLFTGWNPKGGNIPKQSNVHLNIRSIRLPAGKPGYFLARVCVLRGVISQMYHLVSDYKGEHYIIYSHTQQDAFI
jgi:hypothetical protein